MSIEKWSMNSASKFVYNFDLMPEDLKIQAVRYLNENISIDDYREAVNRRMSALSNMSKDANMVVNSVQKYPRIVTDKLSDRKDSLKDTAILLMAGGEGERLRLSLIKSGFSESELTNFTKATFRIPHVFENFGALQINLSFISALSRELDIVLPVIVTTGPEGSLTSEVIPRIISKNKNFGIDNLFVISQKERLHLTNDNKIVLNKENNMKAVVNPDETGGPLMALTDRLEGSDKSCMDFLDDLGIERIVVLQATALYNPEMIETIASADRSIDALGVGIERKSFSKDDPYGTFVVLDDGKNEKLVILEKSVRNDKTYQVKDANGNFLPFNTGFYLFNKSLLKESSLPDYATPPKEILSGLESAPKIGYAATDILSMASNPAVSIVSSDDFSVIKTADDLGKLSEVAIRFNLADYCKSMKDSLE